MLLARAKGNHFAGKRPLPAFFHAGGRSALTLEVQAPFRHFMQTLLDNVAAHNATSCALSNFPEEHHLPKDYMQTILRDLAAAWQAFSLSANALLLCKTMRDSL